jgi:hypothetical protein
MPEENEDKPIKHTVDVGENLGFVFILLAFCLLLYTCKHYQ